jgi:uncharacterized membrane protein
VETGNKIKTPSIEEFETWLSNNFVGRERGDIILYLCVVVYALVFSSLTVFRHYAFKTGAWDLGIFTQSLWTTVNGDGLFYYTCELFINRTGSFFGVHFSPILFLILPFYWIIPIAETLLVLQSFIVALAAIPIYRLAKENAGGRIVGLVFALAYLMYPAIHFVNLYDFHVQAFLPLFFSYAIYYITKENWPKYFLFVFLSLMVEEHASQIIFFIGVYIAWRYRRVIISALRRRNLLEKKLLVPLATTAICIFWYWFTIWQRNTFFPTNPAVLAEFLGAGNFKILGAKNPLEVPLLIIIRPWNAVQALAYHGPIKLLYVVLIFGPLAFYSFKAPSALLPTIPCFIFSFMSQAMVHHTLGLHYEAYTVSFIFVSAIFGLRKNYLKQKRLENVAGSLKKIMVLTLVFFVAASPLCPVVKILLPNYTIYIGEHERSLNDIISMVPSNASVLTTNNIFPHVSNRVDAYVVPAPMINSPIHNIAVNFVNRTMDKVEYVLVDNKTDPIATALVLSLLETKPQFTLISSKDNGTILLYRCTLEV